MVENDFIPHHMNAQKEDFEGNGKWGRYLILPGSDGRAQKISKLFKNVEVKEHPRAHNLYKGTITSPLGEIDVATISTGMGAPSTDIILNELHMLGAKNFIRVGTAGSLQHERIKCGSLVIPTGSVRDESTTSCYIPKEAPATPSLDFLIAAKALIASNKKYGEEIYFGHVHSKDSLYAREFLAGPKKEENKQYMKVLKESGILASEMETSALFTLSGLFAHQHLKAGNIPTLAGAVLAIIGDETAFGDKNLEQKSTQKSIELVMDLIETLHSMRLNKFSPKFEMG
jgi:uridine phosphorylase